MLPNSPQRRIATIVRTKDRPNLLSRCLQSLVEQQRQPDEIVIVNDGGCNLDKTLEPFFNTLNLRVIVHENSRGRACAGNAGVAMTDCDVISFLDDDDRYLPDHLLRLEQTLIRFDARIAYSGCQLVQRDLLGDITDDVLQETAIGLFNDPFDPQRLQYENYIPLINLLIDRTAWLQAGGFDESFDLFEDWDVLLCLSRKIHFYHLDKVTAEYAVWGHNQITQASDKTRWLNAYRQILSKHIMMLEDNDKLELLTTYWHVSQERRGLLQETRDENSDLQLQLLQIQQAREVDQHKVQELAAAVEYEREQNHKRVEVYEAEIGRLKTALSDSQATLLKQQGNICTRMAEIWAALTEHQAYFKALEQVHVDTQQHLHELSKQHAVGMNKAAFDTLLLAPADAYVTATQEGQGIDDYRRLVDWVLSRAQQADVLEQHLCEQIQTLPVQVEPVYQRIRKLIDLLNASRWPQVRRYVPLVEEMENMLREVLHDSTHQIKTQVQSLRSRLGMATVGVHDPGLDNLPSPRPLSGVYPTFVSIAGSEEKPQFMESVAAIGNVPFFLTSDEILVFTTYCTHDQFCRLDVRLATALRINPCHIRVIIRELYDQTPLRVIFIDGMQVFDNRFYPVCFEPLPDSAGKTYRIEMDAPDATPNTAVAVWCHKKQPVLHHAAQVDEVRLRHAPHTLPAWLYSSLENLPLPPSLATDMPTYTIWLNGLTYETSVMQLHVMLHQLGRSLLESMQTAKVILCGEYNRAVKEYAQKHGLDAHMPTPGTRLSEQAEPYGLLDILQQPADSDYLWHSHINAMPSADFLRWVVDMFDDSDDIDLLIPQERNSSGQIRAAYALLLRDGVINRVAHGAPANHPYHGYRRTVDAADSDLLIMRSSALQRLDQTAIAAYRTSLYQVTELIWQLRSQQRKTRYQAALELINDTPPPVWDSAALEQDQLYFCVRREKQLPVLPPPFNRHLGTLLPMYEGRPSILIVDATLPMYDEDSGSLRLLTLMKIWTQMGYRLSFMADNLDSNPKYRYALERLGIEVFHSVYGIHDALAFRQYDFAFICRVEIGHRYMPFVHLLSPQTVMFYDTVDIHFIREFRQAEIENNPRLAELAVITKRRELYNCRMADRVITVTDDDGRHLQQASPGLEYSVIPNIHTLQPLPDNSFSEREGLVFIGNYNHEPNQDAVFHFVEHVLPLIVQRLPEVKLYLIGSHMKDDMKALASKQVKIIGWVDEVPPEFAKRRIFVSWLRYGAGMKGKLGQAMSLGLPIISTGIGAEGMGLVDGKTALIADDPDSFADAVCRLYNDETLWQSLSRNGREHIEQQYGETAARQKLEKLMAIYH